MSSALGKHDLERLVKEALQSLGGKATVADVARHIWENHENDLRQSGDLLFTWQYDMRWAANRLRRSNVMLEAETSPKGTWELANRA
jgi:hypothetical protein